MIENLVNVFNGLDGEAKTNGEPTGVSIEPQAQLPETLQPLTESQLYRLDDRTKIQILHYFQQHVKFTPIRAIDKERFELLVARNRELFKAILELPVTVGPEVGEGQAVAVAIDNQAGNNQPPANQGKYVELDGALKEEMIRCLTKNFQFLVDHQALDYDFKTDLVRANNQVVRRLMELPVKKRGDPKGAEVRPNQLKLQKWKQSMIEMQKQLQASSEVTFIFELDKIDRFFKSRTKVSSQPFGCLNIQWIIVAASSIKSPKQLELYLELGDYEQQWIACNVSASFEILHPKDSETDVLYFFNHTFSASGEGCGGPVALYDYLVNKQFVRNDGLHIKFILNITKMFFHSLPLDLLP